MKKNVQIQVILLLFILGIIIIIGTGSFYISFLKEFGSKTEYYELASDVDFLIEKVVVLMIVSSTLYGIIVAVLASFITRVVVLPISKLTEGLKGIAKGKDIDLRKISIGNENKEVKDLLDAFSLITDQLKYKLKEVDSKKNQIQIILQHMSDGIVVFNNKGRITHINPAGKTLLDIREDEEDFETIFNRINLEVNIEKIMYLENWASFGQKIVYDGRNLSIFFEMFKDEDNNPLGVMVVIKYITESVKLDNMRKQYVPDL